MPCHIDSSQDETHFKAKKLDGIMLALNKLALFPEIGSSDIEIEAFCFSLSQFSNQAY